MMNDDHGFTLIETLIALSILSILLLLPLITFPKLSADAHQASHIAKQLKEDILLAQHVAMSTGKKTTVRIDNARQEYVIRFSATDVYLTRAFKGETMFFEFVTLDQTFSFLANGHPSHSGSFIVRIGDKRYRFTIYLGKGMIYYREL